MEKISIAQAKKMKLVFVDRVGSIERYGNGTGKYWIISGSDGIPSIKVSKRKPI